jgi:hypothetical protein
MTQQPNLENERIDPRVLAPESAPKLAWLAEGPGDAPATRTIQMRSQLRAALAKLEAGVR